MDRLLEWARSRVESLVGQDGLTNSTASAVWHWFAPVVADRDSALASALLSEPRNTLAEVIAGPTPERDQVGVPRAVDAHVDQLLRALDGWTPESQRPAELRETSALLGLGAPGNIAWRALNRLRRPGDSVTDLGRWLAAAILASGLRSLFARRDATLLLDSVHVGESNARDDDGVYWRRVARYCIDGGPPGRPGRIHPPPGWGVRCQHDNR